MSDSKAEIVQKLCWQCPACKRYQIEHEVIAELNQDEIQEIEEMDTGIPARTGHWALVPETVQCETCGREFETFVNDRSSNV